MSKDLNEDETRLYQCVKKYKLIVKQYDELVELIEQMNSKFKQAKKRQGPGGSSSSDASSSHAVVDNNDELVQTISRLLQEPRTEDDSSPDPAGSTSTGNQE